MKHNNISHAHIISAVAVLLLTLLYSFQYMGTSSKLRYTHILGPSGFDFPHNVKKVKKIQRYQAVKQKEQSILKIQKTRQSHERR